MHTRRILLAFSLAASAASVAFADYQTINQSTDSDRLEQLSKTLSQGSYTHPDDLDLPASAKVSVTLRQKTVELNNESLAKKYGNTTAKNSFNGSSSNSYSWLVSHPLPNTVRVSSNFGGRTSFGGQITTVKCFEDNGLLYDLLEENGRGRVLVIDGGGSVRRALVDAQLARLAVESEWEGLVVYGSVRQVDDLEELEIGIQAIAAVPAGAAGEGIGESDVRVNFGGVTFFSGDHLYADNTGIILSEDPLDIE